MHVVAWCTIGEGNAYTGYCRVYGGLHIEWWDGYDILCGGWWVKASMYAATMKLVDVSSDLLTLRNVQL